MVVFAVYYVSVWSMEGSLNVQDAFLLLVDMLVLAGILQKFYLPVKQTTERKMGKGEKIYFNEASRYDSLFKHFVILIVNKTPD